MKRFPSILSFILYILTSHVVVGQEEGNVEVKEPKRFQEFLDAGVKTSQKKGIQGFRLQLYTGNKREVDELRKKFIETYPNTPAYTVFEMPNYKLHVGDFRSKLEAEGFRQEISTHFKGAFVLESRINPELPPKE